MKHLINVALLSFSTSFISAQLSESLQVREYTLSNGMTVWLNEDHSQPKIFGAVVVKAGAKDTPNTGIAHYFEHIMFKGTDKIGTIDYQSEKVLLDSIATRYDELALTTDPKERTRIQQEINEFSIQAAEYVIPNEFNRLISRYGGTRLNAGTSYDYTVYLNTFSPQYIAQWAELNSERLINPVFRMFQSELETVYEEKNMYRDAIGRDAMEKFMERFFQPHPYAYPIIGSTEHLKNPQLSEMKQFFDKYYVASNMGLILSGDFDTETTLPILEAAFSRIKKGEAPKREKVEIPSFEGEEKYTIRFPMPLVKIAGFAFRGVPANHPDQVALNIAIGLLNNSNGTGYLDKLMVDRKLMAAMTLNESFNDAGVLGVIAVPKLVFQTMGSAKEMIWNEINRIKTGDFSEEIFSSLKLEQKRKYVSLLEEINSRSEVMMTLFSQGKSWTEYLKEIEHIDSLTKDDVVAIANKYFVEDYLFVTKKTGKYPKDNLPKPNLQPIIPRHAEASSAYARELEKLPVKEITPRFLDFEKDVQKYPLSPLAKLYVSANPVNDIFTLEIAFRIGKTEQPALTQLAAYLPLLGTEKLSFDEFRGQLQTLGSTLSFEVVDNQFSIKISGFDANFNETLALVSSFIQAPKAEKKKYNQLLDEEKLLKKAFYKSTDNIAHALAEKVRTGKRSIYLNKLSLSDIKKMKGEDLIAIFKDIQKVECDLYYCGTLSVEEVANHIKEQIRLEDITVKSNAPVYRTKKEYSESQVYFCDVPDASQSIIYAYVLGEPLTDESSRNAARLFSGYFGGDMSSLMFQEIREFRSFAYRTSGSYAVLPLNLKNKPGEFSAMLSTQNDKTIDALTILDQLINEMPVKPDRLPAVKQSLINQFGTNYPTFRRIPGKIASLMNEGYTADPNETLIESLSQMTMQDIVRFYEENINGRPVVYMIVGNSRKIDMDKLVEFGNVIKVKKEDLYN
ncbi:putative Zn-dependent peptidase [Parabacteroides sp. PF5-5]|uniref:M16 family metallopeptidase n=1 Tax=unclassified Parabacteroides TaxID=2649774 RepID=UPI002475CEC7|nr:MULTISPECIES: M16 family metallopeptidase [unclassified Parabacteroides]MDH6304553.1 putative Zn-dependent peptidase [Parabacteroides sp. PH5-39]MDH6315295.1 putative Zn-dependent peptidase [Parabacteroides sp. PF5-13]MDH6319211.1 putative Zn-dependent peptidase [Parabacteroides sp. PH5-13]MDH6322942.1 putative Zn-dependent peptidase [Parabacteroides sp. PH5-8]MDH6326486.1 putative Zn-dependent peptidase [Parabacteroides sp. PH5-41]